MAVVLEPRYLEDGEGYMQQVCLLGWAVARLEPQALVKMLLPLCLNQEYIN